MPPPVVETPELQQMTAIAGFRESRASFALRCLRNYRDGSNVQWLDKAADALREARSSPTFSTDGRMFIGNEVVWTPEDWGTTQVHMVEP